MNKQIDRVMITDFSHNFKTMSIFYIDFYMWVRRYENTNLRCYGLATMGVVTIRLLVKIFNQLPILKHRLYLKLVMTVLFFMSVFIGTFID